MVLNGEHSNLIENAETMALEVVDKSCPTSTSVRGAGHFLAEESTQEYARIVLAFEQEQTTGGPRRA